MTINQSFILLNKKVQMLWQIRQFSKQPKLNLHSHHTYNLQDLSSEQMGKKEGKKKIMGMIRNMPWN